MAMLWGPIWRPGRQQSAGLRGLRPCGGQGGLQVHLRKGWAPWWHWMGWELLKKTPEPWDLTYLTSTLTSETDGTMMEHIYIYGTFWKTIENLWKIWINAFKISFYVRSMGIIETLWNRPETGRKHTYETKAETFPNKDAGVDDPNRLKGHTYHCFPKWILTPIHSTSDDLAVQSQNRSGGFPSIGDPLYRWMVYVQGKIPSFEMDDN